MTVFGLIWIAIILYCLIKKDIKYTLFATLLFMTFQSSNVLIINGTGIGPGVLTAIIFVMKIFISQRFVIRNIKLEKRVFLLAILLPTVAIISLAQNQILGETMMLLLQLIVYVVCFISIQFIKQDISTDDIYAMIRTLIVFHVIFTIIEFLTTVHMLPLRPVLDVLVYNDPSTDIVFHKEYYSRVMSTFMEPSYFAGFLVGAFYFLLNQKEEWYKNRFLFIAIIIEILLTKSSTAYGACLIVGMVFVITSKSFNFKQKIILCGISIMGYLILYFGFYSLLDAVIFSKDTTGSFSTRERFDNTAIDAYKSSPIFGVGYKNCRGSSIVYSLLGQMGIAGLSVYAVFNVCVCCKSKLSKTISNLDRNMLKSAKFGVMAVVACQIISCPDLDLCTYWMWLFIYSIMLLGLRSNRRSNRNL